MRQVGEAQAAFRRALLAVAEGRALKEHFDLLWTRMRSQVSEQATFHDAVHLFPTNQQAEEWKWERLTLLGTDIALVRAKHTVDSYTNVSAKRFRSLPPNL